MKRDFLMDCESFTRGVFHSIFLKKHTNSLFVNRFFDESSIMFSPTALTFTIKRNDVDLCMLRNIFLDIYI